MRYEEYMKKILSDFVRDGKIAANEFPDLELYIDQAALFMNKKLGVYKKEEKDVLLTKTMINNYVKNGMIPRPENKKYTKDHLILLTFVYYLKGTFQMNEIGQLMKPLIDNYNSEFDDQIDLESIYRGVMDVQRSSLEVMEKKVRQDIEGIKHNLSEANLSDDDVLELFMLIVNLSMKADAQKYLAQKLMAEFFINPSRQKVKKAKPPKTAQRPKPLKEKRQKEKE